MGRGIKNVDGTKFPSFDDEVFYNAKMKKDVTPTNQMISDEVARRKKRTEESPRLNKQKTTAKYLQMLKVKEIIKIA